MRDFLSPFNDRPDPEIIINKVFVYKVNDKTMTAKDKMELNTRLNTFISEKEIEILGTYEDDILIPPNKREGLKSIVQDRQEYFDENFDMEDIYATLGLKILVVNPIQNLGTSILDNLEILDLLGQNYASLYFLPGDNDGKES